MLKINYQQLTTAQLTDIVNDIVHKVESGHYDALQCYMLGKFLCELGGQIKEKTYSRAWDEAQMYDKQSRSAFGAHFDFGDTGDSFNWEEDQEYTRIKKMLKEREALLKKAVKAKGGEEIIFEGEIIPKVSMKSPGKETIKISLGK